MPCVSLIIVTKNRRTELRHTLQRLPQWFPANGEVLVYDDATADDTRANLADEFPHVRWLSGAEPIGLSQCRNVLYKEARNEYIICLDDDAHVVTSDACEIVHRYFEAHPRCGIITFRVWWNTGSHPPVGDIAATEGAYECGDFLGGACAMRAACFASTGGYAEWMNMYGEETHVAIGAAAHGWEVHYLPEVLVHHRTRPLEKRANRIQLKAWLRQQLCNQLGIAAARLPRRVVPLRIAQLLAHYCWNYGVRKGLPRESVAGVATFIMRLPTILRDRTRLSWEQYRRWKALPPPVYYWTPDAE